MNKLILSILFAAFSLTLSAQKVYFIYLQTEAEQPFFVKMNEKVHSSSASGYLILAKLHDSTYSFTVGFPQKKWPEQGFTVAVNKKDHGYLLKNFGEKGWGLFDLQTLEVQMSSGDNAKPGAAGKPDNKEVSAFTNILSKAADDPSLKERPAQPKVEEKTPEVIVQEVVIKKEEPVVAKPVEGTPAVMEMKEEPKEETKEVSKMEIKEIPKMEVKEEPAKITEVPNAIAEEYQSSRVTKRSESSTTEGFGLVYIDSYTNGENDTIRLLIPNPKPVVAMIKEEPKEEKKMLDIPVDVTKVEEKIAEPKPVVTETPAIQPAAKTNCSETAVEADFFKLRKTMAAAESDDEMISGAKKYFKTKCFTTSQIKNLGALFLTDEGKYKFFDASYSHVADLENFSSLQAELKEEYYLNRFLAMLRK